VIRPRTLARRLALQYLFMADLVGVSDAQPLSEFLEENTDQKEVFLFAESLVQRVLADRQGVDGLLERAVKNWSLNRIAAVERNVLRIACVELQDDSVPVAVAINEAVSLAKTFGSAPDAGGFVNGILDEVKKNLGRSRSVS